MPRPIIYPPLCLAGSVVNPGPTGLIIPSHQLKNPFREDMWVDEIRFLVSVGSQPVAGPGSFLAKIALGRSPITGGVNIPIWLIGKTLANVQDVLRAPDLSGAADPTFVWRLTKPLFVPSGEHLAVQIFSTSPAPAYGANTFTIFASLQGRSIPAGTPRPKEVEIPFATAFVGAEPTAATVDQTYERDLMNPFDVDMFVERFNGRVGVRGVATSNAAIFDSNSVTTSGGPLVNQSYATGTLVRAMSSVGGMMIRDEVPFDHVFYGPERSWQVNTWIPPKAFFKFYLKEAVSGKYRPQIAMVGYRKVPLNDIFV